MRELKKNVIHNINFNIIFYFRYIDHYIPDIFNSFQQEKHFRIETETGNSINYLNMRLAKGNNNIKTKWITKMYVYTFSSKQQ